MGRLVVTGLIQNCGTLKSPHTVRKGRYTRGILLPERAPGARSGSKAPPCVPTISWVYFILGSRIFLPTKCFMIFKRLNVWEQAPGAKWANLKTLPRVYWYVQNEPGACFRSKTPRVYRPFKGSRGCIPQCEGQSQIHPHLEGIITHFVLTCKLHHKQSGKCPPTSVVNYPWKTQREEWIMRYLLSTI